MVTVGRRQRLPSFSQLDGQNDAILSASSSAEVEDDIPVLVLGGVRGACCSFNKRCSAPPARLRHPVEGLATFDKAIQPSLVPFYSFLYLSIVLLSPYLVTQKRYTIES